MGKNSSADWDRIDAYEINNNDKTYKATAELTQVKKAHGSPNRTFCEIIISLLEG